MKRIEKPNFFKRFLAAFMDGLLFVSLWFGLSFMAMPYVLDWTMGYSSLVNLGNHYKLASHLQILVQGDSVGDEIVVKYIDVKDYTEKVDMSLDTSIEPIDSLKDVSAHFLVSHIQYYYCNFLTGQNIELPNDTEDHHYDALEDQYVNPNYDKEMTLGNLTGLPKDIYTLDWFKSYVLDDDERFVLNTETNYFEVKEDLTEESKTEVIKFLKEETETALADLYYKDFYSEINTKIKIGDLLKFIPTYLFSFGLVYFLFPLIFKNGETLGKLSMHLCLVNKNGYKVTRPLVLLRQLFFFFEITFITFVLGFLNWAMLVTLGIGLTALLVGTLISKQNRSLHDFIAGSMVVDAKESIFFKDAKEENKYENEMNENLAKYSSGAIVDAHVIQYKGEVLDKKDKENLDKK